MESQSPFVCFEMDCAASFSTLSDIRAHFARVHCHYTPFECSNCRLNLPTEERLFEHWQMTHKKDGVPLFVLYNPQPEKQELLAKMILKLSTVKSSESTVWPIAQGEGASHSPIMNNTVTVATNENPIAAKNCKSESIKTSIGMNNVRDRDYKIEVVSLDDSSEAVADTTDPFISSTDTALPISDRSLSMPLLQAELDDAQSLCRPQPELAESEISLNVNETLVGETTEDMSQKFSSSSKVVVGKLTQSHKPRAAKRKYDLRTPKATQSTTKKDYNAKSVKKSRKITEWSKTVKYEASPLPLCQPNDVEPMTSSSLMMNSNIVHTPLFGQQPNALALKTSHAILSSSMNEQNDKLTTEAIDYTPPSEQLITNQTTVSIIKKFSRCWVVVDENERKLYKCVGCEKRFTTQSSANRHNMEKCDAKRQKYDCPDPDCSETFGTQPLYKRHVLKQVWSGLKQRFVCKGRGNTNPDRLRHRYVQSDDFNKILARRVPQDNENNNSDL